MDWQPKTCGASRACNVSIDSWNTTELSHVGSVSSAVGARLDIARNLDQIRGSNTFGADDFVDRSDLRSNRCRVDMGRAQRELLHCWHPTHVSAHSDD
jgi:hypothetical protein